MNDSDKKKDVIYGIINMLYSALILMLFWNWFVAPLGTVRINFLWAIGLLLLISVTTYSQLDIKSTLKDFDFSKGFLLRTVVLLIGFLCSYAV